MGRTTEVMSSRCLQRILAALARRFAGRRFRDGLHAGFLFPLLFAVGLSLSAQAGVVTNGSDSDAGSLRQAVADALPGDTITFNPSVRVVTLTSGEIQVTKDLVIRGDATSRTSVSGNNASRVFAVGLGTSVTMTDLVMRDGRVSGAAASGGGVFCLGAA